MGQHARTLWSRRWNNTTSILTIPANAATELTAQTIMAGIVVNGAGGGGSAGYIFSNCSSGASDGVRLVVAWNAGSPLLNFGADSTGTATAPFAQAGGAAVNYLTPGVYCDVAATWTSGLAASTIALYRGVGGSTITAVSAYVGNVDGTTAIKPATAQPITIGNRPGAARALNGDIFYVCRWNRILALTEMRMVQQQGPLWVKDGLVMCWARDRDWGPVGLNPSAVTALGWGQSSAFAPRLYVGRRRDFVFMPAASTFQPAWARNANTVLSTGARTPV